MVGMTGLEPAASTTPRQRSSQTELHPDRTAERLFILAYPHYRLNQLSAATDDSLGIVFAFTSFPEGWSGRQDSNLRHHGPKPRALTKLGYVRICNWPTEIGQLV